MRYFDEKLKTIKKSLDSIDENEFNRILEDCYNVVVGGGSLSSLD